MSIQVQCGACSRQFDSPDSARGRRFKCPACGSPIEVPVIAQGEDLFAELRWSEPPTTAMPSSAPPPVDRESARAKALGADRLPPVQTRRHESRPKVKVQGGLLGFAGSHKLVLLVFVFCVAYVWIGSAYEIDIAGMILAFFGFVVAIGAWRSQKLRDRRDKEADDWRNLEAVAGVIILLALAAYVTWASGRRMYALYELGQQFGFNQRLTAYMAGGGVAWLIFIGIFVLVHHKSQEHGFFKPASWMYVGFFFMFWLAIHAGYERNNSRGVPVAQQNSRQNNTARTNRSGFGDVRPGEKSVTRNNGSTPSQSKFSHFDLPPTPPIQTKQQLILTPKDRPSESMGKLSGAPKADDLSSAAVPPAGKIAEVHLGMGTDLDIAERRPAVRWTAKPDPAVANNLKSPEPDSKTASSAPKTGVKKLAQVPLASDSKVILPRGAGPWLAVTGSAKETSTTRPSGDSDRKPIVRGSGEDMASSIKIYNLITLAEREIKGKIAIGAPRAISPDGRFYAAYNSQEKTVDVWSFEKAKSVARLRIAPLESLSLLDFASDDRLVVGGSLGSGWEKAAQCQIWKLTDTKPRRIGLPKALKFGEGAATISPGGKYLAVADEASVWLVDLDSGALRGRAKLLGDGEDQTGRLKIEGLSFSSDGAELTGLGTRVGAARVVTWNMNNGAKGDGHAIEERIHISHWGEKHKLLEFFPDRSAWLVNGKHIVDAKSGEASELDLKYKEGIFDREFTAYGMADSDRLILGSPTMITTWMIPRGLGGEIESKALAVSTDDLPSGMLPESGARWRGHEYDDDEDQSLSGEELELASRRYRQAAQLKMLAASDDKLSSMFGWYPAGKRPVFGLRVGVGAQAPDGSKEIIPLSSAKSLAEFTGKVGPKVVNELRKRFAQDAFGDWLQTENSAARGIMYVGVGPREKVLPAAKKAEFDVIVMLEVQQHQVGNTKRFDMHLRARVTDAAGDPVWVSPALSSEKAVAAERDGGDLVTPFVADVFAKIDEQYSLQPMPEVKPEAARERARTIAKGDVAAEDRLTAAAELRHYQIAGVLTTDEALPAYRKLLDEETAAAMASGDARKRRAALEKWSADHSL